jgi:hypothetical protein
MPPLYNKTHHADLLVSFWPLRTSCWLPAIALVEGGEEVQPSRRQQLPSGPASGARPHTDNGGNVPDVRFRPRFSCTTSTGSRRSC